MTLAFSIKYPWYEKKPGDKMWKHGYRDTFIEIWHVDPERDGTEDSCGWFKRARHGDRKVFEGIASEFKVRWDSQYSGWFNPNGSPTMSPIAITLEMFRLAAWVHFQDKRDNVQSRKIERFMKRNLYDIIFFGENAFDSLRDLIRNKYGEKKEARIHDAALIVYGYLLRLERHWWQHPRWHVHHWKIRVRPLCELWFVLTKRCYVCGKRFKFHDGNRISRGWDSEEVAHGKCVGCGVAAQEAKSA